MTLHRVYKCAGCDDLSAENHDDGCRLLAKNGGDHWARWELYEEAFLINGAEVSAEAFTAEYHARGGTGH